MIILKRGYHLRLAHAHCASHMQADILLCNGLIEAMALVGVLGVLFFLPFLLVWKP